VKRIILWGLSTLSALVVLFGYHTSTSSVMATTSEGTFSGSLQGQTTSGSGTTTSGAAPPSDGTTGSARSTGQAAAANDTITGDVAQTRWGPVQVQLEVSGSTITNVTILQYPDSNGRDIEIANYSLPQLIQETLDAQGDSISMISGATYTSQGYLQSLQSALDQAGL
jgi:uncharacterized protein with FMN-binding domain